MPRPSALLTAGLFLLLTLAARAAELDELLAALGSTNAFERSRAETQLRQLAPEDLPAFARAIEKADRLERFRAERVLAALVGELIDQYVREARQVTLDRADLETLQTRRASAIVYKGLAGRLHALVGRDPEAAAHLEELAQLEALTELAAGDTELPEAAETRRRELEQRVSGWQDEGVPVDELRSLVAIYRSMGPDRRELNQLEQLRLDELRERVSEREPRLENLRREVLIVGLAALNETLARAASAPLPLQRFYFDTVLTGREQIAASPLAVGAEFEVVRYRRGLLWAWELEHNEDEREKARELLQRHLAATIDDLNDSTIEVRERAADELFLLGPGATLALQAHVEAAGDRARDEHGFLLGLLRWRVRPSTYARSGMHFEDFHSLSFRHKRRKIFDYARVAGVDAATTLRAVVVDDELESSFLVKLAAAKALAGLRDLSGYEFLMANHPEMTMKKPEVSRELLILQGYEYIRDKRYDLAVEELRKVLDEYPFDFRANYHIAFAYLLLKQYEKSIHHFEIARRINAGDQLTLYNLACAYSLAGQLDKALSALRASVEAGFTDADHIEKDPDLEPLRKAEGYRDLLNELRGDSAS